MASKKFIIYFALVVIASFLILGSNGAPIPLSNKGNGNGNGGSGNGNGNNNGDDKDSYSKTVKQATNNYGVPNSNPIKNQPTKPANGH
ncbi:8323_t:CDS:2 [Ambispora leptoticha]|uniref:8323_t:CDS:1 n=1 Tax=Ambispora leptoticha TaxID=144679 RepID=A0A9N9CNB3_9GLOM|nr:8323_t:CDS:2 [Ambispora leptoticha]